MRRTVVKGNWWDARCDEGWEAIFGLGWSFLVGGMLVSAGGALYGYVQAPKQEEATPYALQGAVNANLGFWNGVGFLVSTSAHVLEGLRPDSASQTGEPKPIPVIPFTPAPTPEPSPYPVPEANVIPQPITEEVPDVGECDPYGPMDFSQDPPRLVCEMGKSDIDTTWTTSIEEDPFE